MNILRYIWYIFRHKYFVGIECMKRGLFWRAFTHDLSKFHPKEFFPYKDNFFSIDNYFETRVDKQKTKAEVKRNFQRALNRHVNLNSHHWQYHVLKKNTEDVVLEMPEKDRLEMISDWCGMTRTLGQDSTLEWYNENKDKILLHPHTRLLVEIDLQELEPSSREDTNKEPSGPKE